MAGRPRTRGWTHASVAGELNVESATVTRWLHGDRYPEVRSLHKIDEVFNWPARDQIDLIPRKGYNETWATVFREVLNAHYGGGEITQRGMFKVQVRVARTRGDLSKCAVGSRIVTNTNRLMERDQLDGPGGRRYWIEPGTLEPFYQAPEEWLPAYILPSADGSDEM